MTQTRRTLGYFTTWGTIYGLIIGILTGATGWIMGTVFGAIFGIMSGIMIGLAIGLITALIQRLTFHLDIDLTFYRRRLAVFNGLLIGVTGLTILSWLTTGELRRPPLGTELADFYPLIAAFIPKTVILTVLCVAYISSHYPDWIIQSFYSPDPLPDDYSVLESVKTLVTRISTPPHTTTALALKMCFYLTEILSSEGIALTGASVIISQLIQAVAWSGFLMTFLMLYLIVANAILLTFLKRLVFDECLIELSTYHYKSVMTGISCLFTVLMTSWYWILSPVRVYVFNGFFSTPENMHPVGKVMPIVLGLFMAFHVSKTLAIPDSEKAKRKEKVYDHTPA